LFPKIINDLGILRPILTQTSFSREIAVDTTDFAAIQPLQNNLKNGKGFLPSLENEKTDSQSAMLDKDLAQKLDSYSLESIVELKISRFLDQLGTYYPENLYDLIMKKTEKPLLNQILRRTGGNQVHASRILGINRNTLRKKMKLYGL
jgi:DNA-binding protein Fis